MKKPKKPRSKTTKKLRVKVFKKAWTDRWPPRDVEDLMTSEWSRHIPVRVTVEELPTKKVKR